MSRVTAINEKREDTACISIPVVLKKAAKEKAKQHGQNLSKVVNKLLAGYVGSAETQRRDQKVARYDALLVTQTLIKNCVEKARSGFVPSGDPSAFLAELQAIQANLKPKRRKVKAKRPCI